MPQFHMAQRFGAFLLPSLPRNIKKMAEVQSAFFRQLCHLKKSVTPAIIFRELSERPWVHRWRNQVIGFVHRLFNMPDDSILAEILRDNVADVQQHPSCDNWAGGIVKQYSRLSMASPFSSFWHCMPELPRVSGKHGGSAKNGLGRSACLPKNSSLQEDQALHILCLVSAPQSIEDCAIF